MKYIKKFAVGFVAATLLVGCSAPAGPAGMGGQPTASQASEPVKIAVETQQVIRGALALDGEFVGTIMPGETVNITSQVMGIVESIAVAEGDYVNEGDILFRLDDDNAQSQLDRAIVSYETSQVNKDQALFNANNSAVNAQLSYDQLLITQEQSLFNADSSVVNALNNVERLELAKTQAIQQGQDAIANAKATYAQTLATRNQSLGGSQEISDMQTEKALDDLRDQIDTSGDTLSDLEEQVEEAHEKYLENQEIIDDYSWDKLNLQDDIRMVQEALALVSTYGTEGTTFAQLVHIANSDSEATTPPGIVVGELSEAVKSQIKLLDTQLASVGISASQVRESKVTSLTNDIASLELSKAKADELDAPLEAAYEQAKKALEQAEDSIESMEDELEYQEEVAEIRDTQIKEEAESVLDEQLERSLMSIEQAEAALQRTIDNYDLQIAQAKQSQETAETSGTYTENSLAGQLNQSATSVQTSKESLGILEDVYDYQIENAYLGIESAQLQLEQYTVESPISGVIENITLVEQGMVSNTAVVATVSDYSTMEVVFYVGRDVRDEIELGQMIQFELDGKYYEGQVNEVSNSVDQSTKLFKVTALVDPEEEKFTNGLSVRLTTGTFEEDQTIIVPYDTVIFSNGMSYVFKEVDGKAVKQEVEIGLFTEDMIEIVSGLTEDDHVITTWSEGLRDGVEVMVVSKEDETTEAVEVDDESNRISG